MFQFDLGYIIAFIVWLCIYVFMTNLRSINNVRRFYSSSQSTFNCIKDAEISSVGIRVLRNSLSFHSVTDEKPKTHGISLFEYWLRLTNAVGIKRSVTEQAVIANYFLETHVEALDGFRFNRYQVEAFLTHCNDVIAQHQQDQGFNLSQIQKIHWLYLMLSELGRRYKADRTDNFLLAPIYRELFKGLPKVNAGIIDSLATEALNKSGYGKVSASYSTSMGIKMIFFYAPTFNRYGRAKQFKLATKF